MTFRLASMILLAVPLMNLACQSKDREAPSASQSSREEPGESPTAGTEDAPKKTDRDVAQDTHYQVNPGKSRFTAQVGVGGLFKSFGHLHTIAIKDFGGAVQATSGILGPSSIRMMIVIDSLAEVGKEFSEKDRQKVDRAMHEEALESSKYPRAVFKSKNVSVKQLSENQYEASIKGDLSLHGVTHEVTFPARLRVEGNSMRASGEFMLLHNAYNIKRLSAGGGMVKAEDEIKVSFDIQVDQD